MKKLRVGIAGYGIVGKKRYEIVREFPEVHVVAVCDQMLKGGEVLDGLVQCFTHYSELLTLNLDILFVCMTNDMNSIVTKAGLKSGMNVFCEKPPARNLAEMREVVAVANEMKQQKLMYGFNHRHHYSVQQALRITNEKRLGKILNIRGVYGKSAIYTFNQTDWRTNRDLAGGGVLLDQGIHMLDLMRLFSPGIKVVKSIVSNSHWGLDVEDNAFALLQSDDGCVAMFHSSATQWQHRFRLELNYEKGAMVLEGLLTGSKSYGEETLTVIEMDKEGGYGSPRRTLYYYNDDPSWKSEVREFVECVKNDSPPISSSVNDAYDTMRLVTQIYYGDEIWRKKYGIEFIP